MNILFIIYEIIWIMILISVIIFYSVVSQRHFYLLPG